MNQEDYLLAELIKAKGLLAEALGYLQALNREPQLDCVSKFIPVADEFQKRSLFARIQAEGEDAR